MTYIKEASKQPSERAKNVIQFHVRRMNVNNENLCAHCDEVTLFTTFNIVLLLISIHDGLSDISTHDAPLFCSFDPSVGLFK